MKKGKARLASYRMHWKGFKHWFIRWIRRTLHLRYKPDIGEKWIQLVKISPEILQHLSHKNINYFFNDEEAPKGCIFHKQEIDMSAGFVKRIYVYKGGMNVRRRNRLRRGSTIIL